MKNKRKRFKYLLIVTLILLFSLMIFCINAGKLLAGKDMSQKSNAIIVLSIDNGRLEKGILLFKAGYGRWNTKKFNYP